MRTYSSFVIALALTSSVLVGPSQTNQGSIPVTTTTTSGGSVATKYKSDGKEHYATNEGSSLERVWTTLHDATIPVDLVGTPGVTVGYAPADGRLYEPTGFRYKSTFKVECQQPISAVEVRFLLFDVWGDHVINLDFTRVQDLSVGRTSLDGAWTLYPDNDAERFYASIAYIARARTKDGHVFFANQEAVLAEARRLSSTFAQEDLQPTPDKK